MDRNNKQVEKMKTILITILIIALTGCMTVKRQVVPENIKKSFGWDDLSLPERLKIFNVASPVDVYGTGSVVVSPDGTIEADTSAKARVIGEVLNEGMQTAAGIAKTAGGVF